MESTDKEVGKPFQLPDGRTVKFVEIDIQATTTVCEGCIFEYEDCSQYLIGACYNRSDGKNGVFVEVK